MALAADRTVLADRPVLPVAAALAVGLLALASRPVGTLGLGVTLAVGGMGLALPIGAVGWQQQRLSKATWLAAAGVGVLAFIVARPLTTVPSDPFRVSAALAGVTAAAAEEVFFRRLAYGWLIRWGPIVAIASTAVGFAAVHVPVYGVDAFVIDLAAGVIFGWQRWATAGWSAPAVTHAAANLLQMV